MITPIGMIISVMGIILLTLQMQIILSVVIISMGSLIVFIGAVRDVYKFQEKYPNYWKNAEQDGGGK